MFALPDPTPVTRPVGPSTCAMAGVSLVQAPLVPGDCGPFEEMATAVNVSVAPRNTFAPDEATVIDVVVVGAGAGLLLPQLVRANAVPVSSSALHFSMVSALSQGAGRQIRCGVREQSIGMRS